MIKILLKKLNGISVEEEQKKLCSSSKEDIAAKLFRDMFIPPKETGRNRRDGGNNKVLSFKRE